MSEEENKSGGFNASITAFRLYNNQCGVIELGWWPNKGDIVPFVSISPINPDKRGASFEKDMYNHKAKVFFAIDLGDVMAIESILSWLDDPESGITSSAIPHKRNGKDSKWMVINRNIDMGKDEDGNDLPSPLSIDLHEIKADGMNSVVYVFQPDQGTPRSIIVNPDDDLKGEEYDNEGVEENTFLLFLEAAKRVLTKECLIGGAPTSRAGEGRPAPADNRPDFTKKRPSPGGPPGKQTGAVPKPAAAGKASDLFKKNKPASDDDPEM
jgi:hypothetical protein